MKYTNEPNDFGSSEIYSSYQTLPNNYQDNNLNSNPNSYNYDI